jgi:hypothetical protein
MIGVAEFIRLCARNILINYKVCYDELWIKLMSLNEDLLFYGILRKQMKSQSRKPLAITMTTRFNGGEQELLYGIVKCGSGV